MQVLKVKRIVKHPQWTGSSGYDLALIELQDRVKFNPKKFANLTPPDGARLNAFGFGQTSHPGNAPEFLQGAVFNFSAKATKNSRPQIIRASAHGKAVCFGDSGGPLLFNGTLIATTTFTTGNCKAGGQMGFTRVDMPWIKRVVGL
jgi:trypsin